MISAASSTIRLGCCPAEQPQISGDGRDWRSGRRFGAERSAPPLVLVKTVGTQRGSGTLLKSTLTERNARQDGRRHERREVIDVILC